MSEVKGKFMTIISWAVDSILRRLQGGHVWRNIFFRFQELRLNRLKFRKQIT